MNKFLPAGCGSIDGKGLGFGYILGGGFGYGNGYGCINGSGYGDGYGCDYGFGYAYDGIDGDDFDYHHGYDDGAGEGHYTISTATRRR